MWQKWKMKSRVNLHDMTSLHVQRPHTGPWVLLGLAATPPGASSSCLQLDALPAHRGFAWLLPSSETGLPDSMSTSISPQAKEARTTSFSASSDFPKPTQFSELTANCKRSGFYGNKHLKTINLITVSWCTNFRQLKWHSVAGQSNNN